MSVQIKIPQYEPYFGYTERVMIQDYMQSPGWMTEYVKNKEFEDQIKEYLQVSYCSTVNNGTIALSLALLAVGIKPGDNVVVPNITMFATPASVSFIGAHPIFCDVQYDNLLMDFDQLKELLTTEDIKAVIFVSLNGRWDTTGILMELQSQYAGHVAFIEDAAQSFGSNSYRGKIGGSLDISTFSFSTPKIITTGQGGCITTQIPELAQKVKELKDFGRESGGMDSHISFGINSKFTELQAILGLAQLQQIYYRTARKRQIYELYTQLLQGIPQVQLVGIDNDTVPWFVDARVQSRKKLALFLKLSGIGTRDMYPQLNTQPYYQNSKSYPNSKKIAEEVLWLPSSPTLLDSDIEFICQKIKEFYAHGL